jgi:two-component system, LuxR family, sensor kinase FixL
VNWIIIAWPMVAGAILTLGLIALRIALTEPVDHARLLFALSTFAAVVASGFELAMMNARSPDQFLQLLRGFDLAAGIIIASLAGFVWLYFRCGNRWLAMAGPVVYALGLAFEFLHDEGLGSVTALRTAETFGGASFQMPVIEPSFAFFLPYLALLLLAVFVVHASIQLARRGQRRRALLIGGTVAAWVVGAGTQAALVEIGVLQLPYLASPTYLIIFLAMSYELSADVSNAARVGRELLESQRRLDLATAAVGLGAWVWDLRGSDDLPRDPRTIGYLGTAPWLMNS